MRGDDLLHRVDMLRKREVEQPPRRRTCVNCGAPADYWVATCEHPMLGVGWELFCEPCAEGYAPDPRYRKAIEDEEAAP